MTDSTLNQQLLSVLDNNVLKGDINQDGKVDTQDVAILGDCLVKKMHFSVLRIRNMQTSTVTEK